MLIFSGGLFSQSYLEIDGEILPYRVDECGDTIILANLDEISVSALRFQDDEDMKRYRRYRRYALKVYPYAVDAIRIFREVEYTTHEMKKRERKRYVKSIHKRLKEEFTDPLKDLTKTQGLILIKMIERELDIPIYYLIKDLRGGLTATYWSTLGMLYGHHLKEGYTPDQDPILDAVLTDLDVSFDYPYPEYPDQ
ncbi:MAG: DUF4294 domain-containing protein [Saprospiraceae bacterium]|nr:DUF4294 domain-containing protein [Saprospiraceae bacterium]